MQTRFCDREGVSCGLCSVLNSLLTPIFLVGCSHVWWFFVLLGWILGCSTDFFQGNRAASGKYECHVVTEGDKGPCCPQGRAEGRQCPLEKELLQKDPFAFLQAHAFLLITFSPLCERQADFKGGCAAPPAVCTLS